MPTTTTASKIGGMVSGEHASRKSFRDRSNSFVSGSKVKAQLVAEAGAQPTVQIFDREGNDVTPQSLVPKKKPAGGVAVGDMKSGSEDLKRSESGVCHI